MKFGKFLSLILSFAFLSACGGSSTGPAEPLLSITGNYPSRVGEVTPSGVTLGGYLRINESADPTSLDPVRTGETSSHNITMQIYDALMEFDNELNLHPCLAESYEISDDGLTYTFRIRKGVFFHDDPCFPGGKGREVNAEDVRYSLTRVVDPKNTPRGSWIFLDIVEGASEFANGEAEEISGFQVLDDSTFQIKLIHEFAPFIYRLAMTFTFIHPREAVEYYKQDFFQHPVGTGAFRYVHWKPNQDILLVRNPNYWKKDKDGVQLPYLDGVRFTLLTDFRTEFLELETGNMDSITSIHEDLWSRIFTSDNELRGEYAKYRLQRQELFVTQYFGFNLNSAPFKDNKKLRQAINFAVDREAIIKYVMNGRSVPATGIVPPTMPGYQSLIVRSQEELEQQKSVLFGDADKQGLNPDSIMIGYSYDPEKAKQLLAEAGYPNGEGLPEIPLDLNSGGTTNESIGEAVQSQLAQVGIRVRLQLVEWGQHLENLDKGNSRFFRLGWNADYPDPENFLMLMWSKNFPPSGPNYSFFSNPEYDRIFEEAIQTQDPDQRIALYQHAEKIAVEEAPWLFLFYTVRSRLQQPYVNNYLTNPMETPILHECWLKYDVESVEKPDTV